MLSREVVYILPQNIHYSSLTQSAAARLKQLKGLRIMTTMEHLHMAASAYYRNASGELQQLAWNFFRLMDTDGDGRISFVELNAFFWYCGYQLTREVFDSLDRNRDGVLDFWEVLTLYYIMKTRVRCIQCGGHILEQYYFTCIECFHSTGGNSYDLCVSCYNERRYQHHHHSFLDSYLLLRSLRGRAGATNYLNQALVPQPVPPVNQDRRWPEYIWRAFQALEVALNAATLLATCSIM